MRFRLIISTGFTLWASAAGGQHAEKPPAGKPVETSVCEVLKAPFEYDNKLIRVRGYVDSGFEHSLLMDKKCPDHGIWFRFADGTSGSEMEVAVGGDVVADPAYRGKKPAPRLHVQLLRDRNLEELVHYWELSRKGHACTEGPPPESFPDCTTYRVTATFIGRIDGISRQTFATRARRRARANAQDTVDWKGFGHMRMYDAQIVAQSVEEVVAEDESARRKLDSAPPQ